MYNSATGIWSTAQLSVPRHYVASVSIRNVAIFAGGLGQAESDTKVVDLYDFATGNWSTSQLSVGRSHIGVASVEYAAMFGGGFGTAGVTVAMLIIFCLLHSFMHVVFVVHVLPSFFILF
jgi:hypothetical protein